MSARSKLLTSSVFIFLYFGFRSLLFGGNASQSVATDFYRAGRVEEARHEFENLLLQAEVSSDSQQLWQALMGIAWFHGEIAEYRQAIMYSNRSLEIASSLNNSFCIGRSLCWLGMNYANMGLYDLALEFYARALEIGAPKGVVTIIAVWGLAQQEMGAIHFRKGDIVKARNTIEVTYKFAKQHKIPPGITEGGAHLAEIALHEGELLKSIGLAEDAVATAEKCGCSPKNLSRARVILAKATVRRAETKADLRQNAAVLIEKAIETARNTENTRWLAEGMLVLSQFLGDDQLERRIALLDEALEYLTAAESEIRGTAEAQLGRLFLENQQFDLAKFYLDNGYMVNKELFRRVDSAYILADLSDLESLGNRHHQSWQKLGDSTAEALATKNFSLALENQEAMASELEDAGYYSLAFQWTKAALKTLDNLKQKELDDITRADLKKRRLMLGQLQVRLAARLVPD